MNLHYICSGMDLIAAVNKKDYKLFGAFFRENFPFLVMFADKYVHDMDIAQEAFIQLWRIEGEFVSPEKVKGFLYTTARNLALNHIKHNQIVDEHLRLQEKDSVLFFRNQIIEEETYQLVHKAVEQLPKQSCKIIQLSLQGYSNHEIADQLNISINSVRTLKQSAYKKLRGILKEHFYLLPLMLKMNFF